MVRHEKGYKLMRKRLSYLVAGIALLALVWVYLFSESEVIKYPKQPAFEEAGVSSKQYPVITGFCFGQYASGGKKYEIRADELSIRSKRIGFLKTPLIKDTYMKKPEILFFEKNEVISRILADSGKINMFNRKIMLKGDVRLSTAKNKELSAETMSVNPESGLLSVKGKFTLKRNGSTVYGKDITSDIALEKVSIGKE